MANHAPSPALLGASLAFISVVCFQAGALANPSGPTVIHGSASFAPSGSTLQITNTPNAIINWQSFSIGAGELTRFNQQSGASAVLNRVTTQIPSSILGSLQSNGRVFLINPGGIIFGAGSQIDTAGLIASTLNLSDSDFLAGKLFFTSTLGTAPVVNNGTITTTAVGAPVYLVGPAVTNGGVITSPRGEVMLAAGKSVEVINPGTPNMSVTINAPDNQAVNLGSILADAGRINIFAGLIRTSGLIQANTITTDADGKIVLKGTGDLSMEGARIFARSSLPGGEGGGAIDIQGRNIDMFDGVLSARQQDIHATGNLNVIGSLVEGSNQSISASNLAVEGEGPFAAAIVARAPGQGGINGIQNITINDGGTLRLHAQGYDGSAGIHATTQHIDFSSGGQLIIEGSESEPIPFDTSFTLLPAFARIEATETQTITGSPTITINGESGGAGLISSSTQTIQAGNLTLTGSAAEILGGHQTIAVDGDLFLGGGAASIATNAASNLSEVAQGLRLSVSGNVTLAGGNAPASGALISSNNGPIDMVIGGRLALEPGAGAPPSISSSTGDISITAGRNIAINASGSSIATLGDIALVSGGRISEHPAAEIVGNSLNIAAKGDVDLRGLNRVSTLGGTARGDVTFNNTSPILTVSGLDLNRNRALSLTQNGDLLINGDVTSGAQTISAMGDILISPGGSTGLTLHSTGAQRIQSRGDLTIQGGPGSKAFALVSSARDIDLTVGGVLRLNGGASTDAWARVQTERRNSSIELHFPNRSSGGWFVNGVEAVAIEGGSGFYAAGEPATPGDTLLVDYGE